MGTLDWRLDEIERADPNRAASLRAAGASDIILSVVGALKRATIDESICLGWERAHAQPEDSRAVVQFRVGRDLFDVFFNSPSGYRAQFRSHFEKGDEYNRQLIEAARGVLLDLLPDSLEAFTLTSDFEVDGSVRLSKETFVSSLVPPKLSKIWFCTRRIVGDGRVETMPLGVVGEPRILVGGDLSWAAPYREDGAAWLDIKGAFLGACGPYQPKDPIMRARRLQANGEA